MKRILLAVLAVFLLGGTAVAGKYDIRLAPDLGDAAFGDFVLEAGVMTAYRGIAPAEAQGITGFDVGAELTLVDIDDARWQQVLNRGATDPPDFLPVPKLHARKGLPFGFDVGAFYSQVPDSNIALLGGEVQWALLKGGVATPALAFRGSYSTLRGVDDLDLYTLAGDVVVSKGFLLFTPYAGVGVVRIVGDYAGNDPALQTVLTEQEFTEPRVFAGVQASLVLFRLTLDAEYLERPVYTVKLSLGW